MTLLSLDLDSTRARAVGGWAGDFPLPLQLEPPRHDFPLVLSWTGRSFDIGSMGLLQCREKPFLVCQNFLPHLGEDHRDALRWQLGRHQLDGQQALKLIFQQLRQLCCSSHGVTFAVPPYLGVPQIRTLSHLAQQQQYPLLGSVASPLALALAGHAEFGWAGSAVVVDLDDHALWLALVSEDQGQAILRQTWTFPGLGMQHWKNRLLNTLADCCIAHCRRDPRASAAAEQSLYLQLDGIMDSGVQGRSSHVAFQASNWYQELALSARQVAEFCKPLARQVVGELAPLFNSEDALSPPQAVLLSYRAASLPGLVPALQQFLQRWSLFHRREPFAPAVSDPEDFGENLLQEEDDEMGPRLILLTADAAARGAHCMGGLFFHSVLPAGHLGESAPLPGPQAPETGPARIHYLGRDYYLPDRPFTIGKGRDCDMEFDYDHPEIAHRHCAVVYDLRRYLLKNLARDAATWINNQFVEQMAALCPGDWIRLGQRGPRLRFLGGPSFEPLSTIA